MKRVLFLTNQLPYPPVSGGTIKSWRVVQHLADRYRLSVFTFLKGQDVHHIDDFRSKLHLEECYAEEIDIPRSPAALARSYLLGIPLNLYRNRSAEMRERVRETSKTVDAIIVDHYEMYQYIPAGYEGEVVLHQHNAEHALWQGLASIERNPVKRMIVALEAKRICHYERQICADADVILAAPNDAEKLMFSRAGREKFRPTYHLDDDTLSGRPELRYEDTIEQLFFVGTLTWEANIDGLCWFIDECWDSLRALHPDLKFMIVGRNPDARIQQAAAGKVGITLLGFVEDLTPFYDTSRVFVCPLRFGSGTKVKVVGAMYRGLPVATTTVGAEGLENTSNGLTVSDDPGAFSQGVSLLLSDRAAWEHASRAERQYASEHLSWAAVLAEFDGAIDEA